MGVNARRVTADSLRGHRIFSTFYQVLMVAGVFVLFLGGNALVKRRFARRRQRMLRRAGVAEGTAAAPPHHAKALASTVEERRALALGALFRELSYDLLKRTPEGGGVAKGKGEAAADPLGIERFALMGPGMTSPLDLERESGGLRHYWGVVDSASAMRTVLSLVEGGARGEFDLWCSVLAHHELLGASPREIAELAETLAPEFPKVRKGDDSLSLAERLQLARDNWRRLHPGGTAAWDYARLVAIVWGACLSGYLDNGQAWAIVLDIDQKATRAFRSWEQFGESILVGRHLHFGVHRSDYDDVVKRLLAHPQSPWRTIPWNYTGPKELPP